MPKIDYMKVLDVAAKTLNADKFEIDRPIQAGDKFEVTATSSEKAPKKFTVSLSEGGLELEFSKNNFPNREFEKWLADFEYGLEQAFLTNVNVKTNREATKCLVRIEL